MCLFIHSLHRLNSVFKQTKQDLHFIALTSLVSLRLVYFIQKLVVLVILEQEKIVFVIFFLPWKCSAQTFAWYCFCFAEIEKQPGRRKPTQSKHRWNVTAFCAAFCAVFWQLPKKVIENASKKNISIIKRKYLTFFTCKTLQIFGVVFATWKQHICRRERDATLTEQRWCKHRKSGPDYSASRRVLFSRHVVFAKSA